MDGQFLLTVFLMLLGSGIFLRIVAKEKRRRERYLELRVMQQNQPVKELKQRVAAEATQEPIVIATPADLRGGGLVRRISRFFGVPPAFPPGRLGDPVTQLPT